MNNKQSGLRNIGSKKAMVEQTTLLIVIIAIVILVVLFAFSYGYKKYLQDKDITEKCRITMVANSKIRMIDLTVEGLQTGQGLQKERFPVECPRLPDLEIKLSDVKSKSDSTTAMKYYIMNIIANEMKNCAYRYINDLRDTVPFNTEPGTHCGYCRLISFDKGIKDKFKVTPIKTAKTGNNDDSPVIDNFMSFLMNAKAPGTNMYYSEYFYGFKKNTDENTKFSDLFMSTDYIAKYKANGVSDADIQKMKDGIDTLDVTIDPAKKILCDVYYH